MRLSRTVSIAAVAACFAVCAARPAPAQNLPSMSRAAQAPIKTKPTTSETVKPPPALPGTLNLAAPAEKTQLDLAPTEALFDAINRGDIASARDAVNRGADLWGHNVLGMTPLDLSVDLARNDITFLLLSLRAGSGPSPTPGSKIAATPGKAAPKVAAARQPQAPTPVAATRPQPAPQQFAGPADPGTPNPQAGFLGFGGSVQ